MQIQCPYCAAKLQLGHPRAGRYKPRCKQCEKPFLVLVSEDAPPRVRVGKPRTQNESSANQPSANRPSTRPGGPNPAAQTRVDAGQSVDQVTQTLPPTAAPSTDGTNAPAAGILDPNLADRQDQGDRDLAPAPTRLGGYKIVRMLGRGAMGAVYQAKQISLDRDVALKTIRGRLADNPASLARFTREAYAAAQLSHHNVVQIYDFGEDEGQRFFSMEWVRGGSLSDLVREKGSIDPKLAATYALQAARGLQFAHRSGMVHRDVKPSNLLLSDDGVVKVADLGLVKVPEQGDPDASDQPIPHSGLQSGTQVTMQGTAVGTPAYMAPEQSADASTVDHRADIYSLGCSLFFMLAGRSPYEGSVVSEVIDQHAHSALPDLAAINPRVPAPLAKIVNRAMAKRPSDRYASLAEMIDQLQSFLGVTSLTGFSPSSDQADRWETLAAAYAKTQLLKRWSEPLTVALVATAIAITLASPWISLAWVLFGPMMLLTSCAVAVALAAISGPSAIADHVRRWLGTLSWFGIGVGVFSACVLIVAVLASGGWIGALAGAVVGTLIAVAYHYAVTVASAKLGQAPLQEAKRFVRDLRIGGAEESGLRDFLARYAGKNWQTIYESLFGYDALIKTRRRLAADKSLDDATEGPSLRDRLCAMLAVKTEKNRRLNDREKLAQVEQASLISQGVSAAEAREQSWQMASAIMETAQLAVDQSANNEQVLAEAKRMRIKAMLEDARSGKYKRPRDRYAGLKFAFSGYTRMLAGCLLLAAFSFAVQTTGLDGADIVHSIRSGQIDLDALSADTQTDAFGGSTSVWSIGVAGLLLCLSAFVSGWRMTPFAVVATLVILFGAALGIPAIGPAAAWMVAAVIGLLIYLPGVLYGEVNPTAP
ncbi:serine/threonine protein kinase [Stieleria sp. TO1_6]|uniref:serine/threonine-protein kinase n=1 Tax=Stieleria tagensis TaxID=2956795 RepID=UPI00209B022A|nr:serine/threonine-protein kinase [Stieleria tagensis]MCO8124970.1 serine/threonine protein kinase [Stieleria tagensis]